LIGIVTALAVGPEGALAQRPPNNVPERDTRDALTRARAGKTTAIA